MKDLIYQLQNGSDIRGIAIEHDEKKITLTDDNIKRIAFGFIKFLENKSHQEKYKIAIGFDSRLTNNHLKNLLCEVFYQNNIEIYDCDLASTPAMFMANIFEDIKCDGSIMITASHLPYYYNGLKFFTKDGGLEKEDIKSILDYSFEYNNLSNKDYQVNKINLINMYSNYLVDYIKTQTNLQLPLDNLKIIVDAGNGSGGFFINVLEQLGANTIGSQFLDPDGTFPNHIPNPENNEAMNSIKNAVLKHKADLGIIFDTDVDRAAIVLSDGQEVNKNALIALISNIVLKQYPNTTIVTDSITSDGLSKYINELGGKHIRFQRGYKNVINKSKQLNEQGIDSQLAIETSGHGALKENYYLDDGAYLVCKVLVEVALLNQKNQTINDLISTLEYASIGEEVRVKLDSNNFKKAGLTSISELTSIYENKEGYHLEQPNYEGVKIRINNDGWVLVRLSVHEPLIVVNYEGENITEFNKVLDIIKQTIQKNDIF